MRITGSRLRTCVVAFTVCACSSAGSGEADTSVASGGGPKQEGMPSASMGGSTNSSVGGSLLGGSSSSGDAVELGGTTNSGGTTSTGGLDSDGGSLNAAGGNPPVGGNWSGGTTSMSGGASTTGGTSSVGGSQPLTGGDSSVGGDAAGGSPDGAFGGSAGSGTGSSAGATAGGSGASGASGTDGGSGEACPAPAPGTSGQNPLFTDQYTADPAPLVHDCTFYIACGHDEGNSGFVLNEWFILKSTDMVNWTKTQALSLDDFAWAPINAWAGHLTAHGGRFYWYVPVAEGTNGAMAIGVAVSDAPEGPYTDAIGGPLVNDAYEIADMGLSSPEQTPYTIDPAVFVDDDGHSYLYYGGFWRLVIAPLNDDMISLAGPLRESTPANFFEAPFVFKRSGVYYVVYAAQSNPAPIEWARSDSPMGPWTYGGVVLDPLPDAGPDPATSHPGVAEFAGEWYLVYHLSDGPNGGGTYRREVAIDKLFFDADGSIQRVTPSAGLRF